MRTGKLLMVSSAVAALLAGASAARADVVISKKATANMSCSAGVCSPTAAKATLNATDLANMLASGDVTVKTGSGATNIVVKDSFSWTATSRLTLDAMQSVEFDKPVTVAGTGAVTIATNDGGSGGDLLFGDKGNLTFWDTSSSLIISGNSYTLVKDIATLASDIAANPSGFYALASDYEAKREKFDSVPIPTVFAGTFEGLGNSIVNLKIKHYARIKLKDAVERDEGFFAYISAAGIVRDLHLRKTIISSSNAIQIGGLAGNNQGTLLNVTIDGNLQAAPVRGGKIVLGGLAGRSDGSVIHSASSASVIAGDESVIGGLVGGNGDGKIVQSQSTGSVTASNHSYAGGLAGSSYSTSLSFSSASVTVGENSHAGGLLGFANGVSQSYATGVVQAAASGVTAGGLAGEGYNITNSYATGTVQGGESSYIGGLVGRGGLINTSYSIGVVAGTSGSLVGGLIGRESGGHLQHVYWDTDTSDTDTGCGSGGCNGAVGLTTEQFQSGLPAGFDPEIWAESTGVNGGFPYLVAILPK